MQIVTSSKNCKCKHCGNDIYSGDKKFEAGKRKFICWNCGNSKDGLMAAKKANTVQKKWMDDITLWANNGGLRLLYGDEWEFSAFQRHHVLGRAAKNNKVAIGHEFILPVPHELHDVHSNHGLNVTHHKHKFTNAFGKQRELFNSMYQTMKKEGYIVPDISILDAIIWTNA